MMDRDDMRLNPEPDPNAPNVTAWLAVIGAAVVVLAILLAILGK